MATYLCSKKRRGVGPLSSIIYHLCNMEDLFSTNIAVNNQNIIYRVIFDNEKYTFLSEAGNHSFPSFSFTRQHDEWVDAELLPPEIRKQAVDALEKYLMKQH
jgi:protoporphyrinogen oxidase